MMPRLTDRTLTLFVLNIFILCVDNTQTLKKYWQILQTFVLIREKELETLTTTFAYANTAPLRLTKYRIRL